jgi:hypothetical protein
MVEQLKLGDSFFYDINGFEFNVFVELFNNELSLYLVLCNCYRGKSVLEIPETIKNIAVKKINTHGAILRCNYIKFPKDIIIDSTFHSLCSNIEFTTLQDFYNNANVIRNNIANGTQLFINGVITEYLLMPASIRLINWKFNILDFREIEDLSQIHLEFCKINKIVNTDKITILPPQFDIGNYFEFPLRFPNLTVIESQSIWIGRTIITTDKLVFIEQNAVKYLLTFQREKLQTYIITESNPIIYEQSSSFPIEIIKHEKNILP